jgi:glycogen synthase
VRVLMTTDSVGGVWQYSLALARGLVRQHDCELLLACLGEPARDDLRDLGIATDVELVTLPLQLEWMRCGDDTIRRGVEEVGRLAARWKADVIHSNQHCFGLLSDQVPTIVVSHSDVLSWIAWQRCRLESPSLDIGRLREIVQGDPFLRRYSDLVAGALAASSAVVSPSRFVASSLAQIFGVRSRVIRNGLWPEVYQQKPKEPTAVVVGRLWDGAKNAGMAVRSVEGLPMQLIMVGPTVGPSGETIDLPSSDNTRYLGPATWAETREILSRASIYLATSSYEPFGLAALEAAFSGCMLLATDIPSYREIWEETAVYCRINDAKEMRAALAASLRDPARTREWGRLARERAASLFGADRMAAEYAALYRLLLGGSQTDTLL